MMDLRCKYIKVETKEECEKLFEIAKAQGFKWAGYENSLYVDSNQRFPDIILFRDDRTVVCGYAQMPVHTLSEVIDCKDEMETLRERAIKKLDLLLDRTADYEAQTVYEYVIKKLERLDD